MDEQELEKLRKWLGQDFSDEELQQVYKEDPQLAQAFPSLEKLFTQTKLNQPPLSPQFTSKVLRAIKQERFWSKFHDRFLTWRNLAVATACSAAFVFGWYAGHQKEEGLVPSVTMKEITGSGEEKVYQVRFVIREPQANTVAVAGDFNQWVPALLRPEPDEKGVYSIEIPIKEGTYGYSFVIDGDRWVSDQSANQVIGDGFGGKNTIIRL